MGVKIVEPTPQDLLAAIDTLEFDGRCREFLRWWQNDPLIDKSMTTKQVVGELNRLLQELNLAIVEEKVN